MIQASLTNTIQDLQQILQLQEENHARNISETELRSEGFVTLRHDLEILEKMHKLAPSVIIKEDNKVVAYALTMMQECRRLIPDLEPMFALLDKLSWNGKSLNDHSFYIMGQVCVAKQYRGQGLFDELYKHHKKIYNPQFDLIITEIATRNHRSIRAHERVGFKTIHIHQDELDEWAVVGWNWA